MDLIFPQRPLARTAAGKSGKRHAIARTLRTDEMGTDHHEHAAGAHLFLRSREAKERLKPALNPGNVDKTMAAPVTAIIAYDTQFYEVAAEGVPHNQNARAIFAARRQEGARRHYALRNGSMQAAISYSRRASVGLDCGPMSGFNNAKVDAEFFAGTGVKSNFLCNLATATPRK